MVSFLCWVVFDVPQLTDTKVEPSADVRLRVKTPREVKYVFRRLQPDDGDQIENVGKIAPSAHRISRIAMSFPITPATAAR